MIRTALAFVVGLLPTAAFAAGTVDSITVSTEAKAGTTYISVSGGYTSTPNNKIIQVDIVCTTDATKTENQLAAELTPTTYKRLSNNAVSANTFEITATLFESGVAVSNKKTKVSIAFQGGRWVATVLC